MSPLPQLDHLRVVLVNTRNPLNIGASARAMSNFGFLHLRVVNPFQLAFREARSAVGASPLLASAEEFKSVADAVADCSLVIGTTAVGRRELRHPVRRLDEAARLIGKGLRGGRVALLFGSEKRGLSNEDVSHCQWLLRIPTREAHRSMNLGHAVAVCLYELVRSLKAAPQSAKTLPASAGDLERLTSILLDALRSCGYLKTIASASLKTPSSAQLRSSTRNKKPSRSAAPPDEKIRRFIRRLNLSAADAALFLGILRQILRKLRSENAPSR